MMTWAQRKKTMPEGSMTGVVMASVLIDVEDVPEGEQAGDEEEERRREVGPPRHAVEQPGVQGDDEADEEGRGQVGVRPPGRDWRSR